jgi:cytochrome c-type biogenesis protein CcmH/NrfG
VAEAALGSADPDATSDAIAALGRIIASRPGHERALLLRGRLYKRVGRLREALRDFEAVLEENPDSAEATSAARQIEPLILRGRY